ncbi:hypothetical protein BLD44_007030 [Mastigocladus laminosus UU774]|nr:hypothetical protein BLD44_007030 [Mastigocladus laminosus UU774]
MALGLGENRTPSTHHLANTKSYYLCTELGHCTLLGFPLRICSMVGDRSPQNSSRQSDAQRVSRKGDRTIP